MPKATRPTVPNKNFFIFSLHFLIASFGLKRLFEIRASSRSAAAILDCWNLHNAISAKMPSPKCNTRQETNPLEANDLLGISGTRWNFSGSKIPPGFLQVHSYTAHRFCLIGEENKPGTLAERMLYVDNRGIAELVRSASV